MTPGRLLVVAGALFLALWGWTQYAERPDEENAVREHLGLPNPDLETRIRFFFEQIKSSQTTEMPGHVVRDWQVIGERALREFGSAAFDYILSEDRFADYHRSPTLVTNVLRLIEESPVVRDHPRFPAFVHYWLDPKHHPVPRPGDDWTPIWRRDLFRIIARYPRPENAALCVAELRNPDPVPDMRGYALDTLLFLNADLELGQVWPLLAGVKTDAKQSLRARMLAYLLKYAETGREARDRATVKALRPFLHDARGSADPVERMRAEATLRRLGDPSAEAALVAEHKSMVAQENQALAWNALRLLCADGPHPYVREVALPYAQEPDDARFSYHWALKLLTRWWLDDPDVRALAWKAVREHGDWAENALTVLRELHRVDREQVVKHLQGEFASDDPERMFPAVRFAMSVKIPELGPTLLHKLDTSNSLAKPYYYRALVDLGNTDVVPRLVAELDDSRPDEFRNLGVTELLVLQRGLDHVAKRLAAGDEQAFDALFRSAQSLGRNGVPPPLVPALLQTLREASSEDAKLRTVFMLRCRGTLEGVREECLEIYRREPSRRVAQALRGALIELSHRATLASRQ